MITDDQIATALLQASDSAPLPSPVPLDDVLAGVRHRRRVRTGALTGTAVALAAVLVASPLLRGSGSQDLAPVQPATSPTQVAPTGPMTTHTTTVDDLSITTEGPVVILGGQPTGVVMLVTNHGAVPWTGQLGVGLSEPNSMANGNSPSLYPAAGQPTLQGYGVLLADNQNSIDGVLDQTAITIAPGGTHRLEVVVRADSGLLSRDLLTGWVPFVVPGGLGAAHYPDPSTFPLLHAVTELPTGAGQPLITESSYVRGGNRTHPGALVAVDLANVGAEPISVIDVSITSSGVAVRGAIVSSVAEQEALLAPFPEALGAAEATATGSPVIAAQGKAALAVAVAGVCTTPASSASASVTLTYTVGAQTTPRTLVLPANLGGGSDWLPAAIDMSCSRASSNG